MASTARIDELKKKFDENPRRYFAPLANEFRKAGEVEQAIMICEEFLPQQPGHMSGHIVYGQALFEAGRMEESRTVFETALTLDPENLIALRHLGDIARGQGDMESARRWYDRVLEADPRNDEIQGLIASLGDAPFAAAPPASAAAAPAPAAAASTHAPSAFAPPPTEPPASRPAAPPPPPLPEPIDLDLDGELMTSMPATVPTPAPLPSSPVTGMAEGLESVEFSPPTGPLDHAHDLGSSLESGEFTAPETPIQPLVGLEESSLGAFERLIPEDDVALPMLDLSTPVDPSSAKRLVEEAPEVGPSTLEFSVPTASERAAIGGRTETSTMPELEPEGDSLPELRVDIPAELPPSVIAAESALMDLDELDVPVPAAPTPAPTAAPAPSPRAAVAPERAVTAPQALFATETMAELFLKQGFRDQALEVYRQLLAANPDDERLQQRAAALAPAGPAAAGDSVRDFLARLATLRPGERSAPSAPPSNDDFAAIDSTLSAPSDDDFAATGRVPSAPSDDDFAAIDSAHSAPSDDDFVALGSVPAAPSDDDFGVLDVAQSAPSADEPATQPAALDTSRSSGSSGSSAKMSTGLERGAESQGSGGSIDALFGNRAVRTSEDSAASALAQAFGGAPAEPAPAITGRPARAASAELSLDSVFRDSPPRPARASQNFSFDQFFSSESAAADRTPAGASPPSEPASEPAERGADDIEQFNSWLQGLKPK